MIGRHRCVAMTTKPSLWYSNGLLWINERPVAHPDWPHQRKVMQRDAISIPDTRPFLLEKFFSICHPHLKPVTDRKNVIIPSFFLFTNVYSLFLTLTLFLNIAAKERTEHFGSLNVRWRTLRGCGARIEGRFSSHRALSKNKSKVVQ